MDISKLKLKSDAPTISLSKERADLAMSEKGFEGIISRKINRKISAPVAKLLFYVSKNINPNYLTLITLIIGLGTGLIFVLSKGNPIYAIWGGILIQVCSIADGVDGDYSRYLITRKETQASFGAYLDGATDKIIDLAIIYGIGVYLMNVFPNNPLLVPLIFAAASFYLLRRYIHYRIIKTYNKHKEIKHYIFSKMNFIERDITLLILSVGGILEALSYISPQIKGYPLVLSMALFLSLYLCYFVNSFFELRRNLNNI